MTGRGTLEPGRARSGDSSRDSNTATMGPTRRVVAITDDRLTARRLVPAQY